MNERLIDYLRNNYGLIVGELSAEIAIQRASAGLPVVLKGRDTVTGLPRELQLAAQMILDALTPSTN